MDDIDLVVKPEDMKKVEKELGGEIEDRDFNKGSGTFDNLGFTVNYKGLKVEVTNGLPSPEYEDFLNKMHDMKVKCNILGREVYLSAPEREVYLRAYLSRKKDFRDLESYKKNINIRDANLEEILEDMKDIQGEEEVKRVQESLKEVGLLASCEE